MSPLLALRRHLRGLPHLKGISTQAGFAEFLGRSESLVRAVESGRVEMSAKFAAGIAGKFDIPINWLTREEVEESELPPTDSDPMGLYPSANDTPGSNVDGDTEASAEEERRRSREPILETTFGLIRDHLYSCDNATFILGISQLMRLRHSEGPLSVPGDIPDEQMDRIRREILLALQYPDAPDHSVKDKVTPSEVSGDEGP